MCSAICTHFCFAALGVEARPTDQLFSGDVEASDVEAADEFLQVLYTCGAAFGMPAATQPPSAPAGFKIQRSRAR